MSKEKHSPTPWSVGKNSQGWATHVKDAEGVEVASCWGAWGKDCTEPATSNAALIVEAVNEHIAHHRMINAETYDYIYRERDKLRDLVRRLANMAETTIPDAMENWDGFTSGRVEFEREAYALIREAREAIGEGIDPK